LTLHFPSSDIGLFGRRQRHARGHRVPVRVVGSADTHDPDTAVVADTFGPRDVMRLRNGCPCCTVRVELQTALRALLATRARRHFTRVAIASNEDPGAILRTFATPHALGDDFYVEDDSMLAATGANSFVLTEDTPLRWGAFSRFITTLQALRGADLLHMKGLLNIAGCRGPVAVQFMQHLVLSPVELQAWPDGGRKSRLAFVTRGIEEQAVRHLFSAVHTLSTSC
jgi:G3E family GTPase